MLFLCSEVFNTPFEDKKLKDGIKAVFLSKHLCQNWSYVLQPWVIRQAVLSLLSEGAVSHVCCFCNGRHPLLLPKILWFHENGRDQWMGKGCRKLQAVIKSNVPAAGSFTHPTACSSHGFWEAPTSRWPLPRDPHKGQAGGCQELGHTVSPGQLAAVDLQSKGVIPDLYRWAAALTQCRCRLMGGLVASSCLLQEAPQQPEMLGMFLKGSNCSRVILFFLCTHNLSKSLYGFVLEY